MDLLQVHKTTVIHPEARLGDSVRIGPYSVIGPHVVIGEDVHIGSHCVLEGHTTIGKGSRIFTGAVIGSIPQDKKHQDDDKVVLVIGEHNIIREYVTINPGTVDGGGKTVMGDHNLLMAYSHVAHDCSIGNHCVMANAGTLGGHVTLEDRAIVGGLTAIHQFVRLGTFSIVGGCSKVVQDIPPYSLCDGHPAKVRNINYVGLKRSGMDPQVIRTLRRVFRIIFHSGLTKNHALARIEQEFEDGPEIKHLIFFIKTSKRGLCS